MLLFLQKKVDFDSKLINVNKRITTNKTNDRN